MGLPEARVVNPYVFIVGCARSGTTLLERMVDAHPQIAITHQWHGIPRPFEKQKGMTAEGLVRPKLISHLLKLPWFPAMAISQEGPGLTDREPDRLGIIKLSSHKTNHSSAAPFS